MNMKKIHTGPYCVLRNSDSYNVRRPETSNITTGI